MPTIEVIRSEADWKNLAEAWNVLLSNSITDVPFLRYEFLFAWWQHRGGGEWPDEAELFILVSRDDSGGLEAALPLFISKNRAGKLALMLLGSIEIADFLDVLAPPEKLGDFLDAAFEYLTGPDAPQWEVLQLDNVLEESLSIGALKRASEKHGLSYSIEKLQPAPIISLPGDFSTYVESLDGRYRREVLRKMRNALRYFIPVKVTRVENSADLAAEMADFFTMMREENHKDAFLTQPMADQMQAIAKAAFDHGWLDLRFLLVGREKAAGYINFIYNNRVWVYNSAWAEKFDGLSPGIALMGLLIEEAVEQGYQAFDLMRGDEEYKYQLGGQDRWVVRVTISR